MDPQLRAQMQALRAGDLANTQRLQARVVELEHELAGRQPLSVGSRLNPSEPLHGPLRAHLPSLSPHPRSLDPKPPY